MSLFQILVCLWFVSIWILCMLYDCRFRFVMISCVCYTILFYQIWFDILKQIHEFYKVLLNLVYREISFELIFRVTCWSQILICFVWGINSYDLPVCFEYDSKPITCSSFLLCFEYDSKPILLLFDLISKYKMFWNMKMRSDVIVANLV